MRQSNPALFLFVFFVLGLGLTGCGGTGKGYNGGKSVWSYQPRPSAPASQPPGLLGKPQAAPVAPVERIPGAGPQAAMPAANLPPVKVALLLPLSGANKELGEAMLNAAEMAVFDSGYTNFQLMPRDTGGAPEQAANAARAALAEGAQIVLGPVFSAEVAAVKPITQAANINMIAFSTDWTLAGGNAYVMGFLPFDQVDRIVRYAGAQKLSRLAVLAPSGNYGQAVMSVAQSTAPRAGASVVKSAVFQASGADLKQQAGLLAGTQTPAAAPFNAVLIPASSDIASSASDALSGLGLPPQTVRRLGTGLWDDPAAAYKTALDGAWFAAPSPRGRASFERRFFQTYNYTPPRLSSLAYDATALSAVLARTGAQAAGRPAFDGAALSNANGFAGIDGIFRFRADGTAERGLAVLEIKGGRIRVIDEAPATFQSPGTN